MRCLWLLALVASLGIVSRTRAAVVDFKRDIQPIFQERCYECHGEKRQKGGIRFDRKSTVFDGGDSGKPLIVANKSGESPLVVRVVTDNPDEIMPPKGEKLSESQIKLLRDWIDQGATWPEDNSTSAKRHWAYEKPVRHPLPVTRDTKWARNPIDNFVLEKLEREKLAPSVEADRATLLRRVSLDLIGLPPSLKELEEFLADTSPDAYEKAIDRLLASPHYGERWARSWLDMARYADTQGYEKDNRRTMWPWRDWVVNALNENMTFDQFTLEQLAGDMLPNAKREQKVATGFHRNTMTNTEGGTDDEEFRHEAVVDRVNTTLATWMATTIGCAQCHNHKYDPMTMKEYYQIYAFFNNTADSDKDDERPTLKVPSEAQELELSKRREVLKEAEQKFKEATDKPEIASAREAWEQKVIAGLTNWERLQPSQFVSVGGATIAKQASGALWVSGKNPSNDTYVVSTPLAGGTITGIRLEVLETGTNKALGRQENGNFVLHGFEASLNTPDKSEPLKFSKAVADFSEKGFDVSNLITGKGDGWAVGAGDEKNKVRRSAYFSFEKALTVESNALLTVTLRHSDKHAGANIIRFRLYSTHSKQVGPPDKLPEDVRKALLISKRDSKQSARIKEYFESIAPELKHVYGPMVAARKAEKEWFDSIPIVSVLEELPKPRETHMLMRGSFLSKGDRVQAGVPAVLNPIETNQTLNRVTLAKWLTDTNNPMTARVIVNRFWEQLFGIGIVETSEDFGTQGEPPSHPQLLDWLAVEFMHPTVSGDGARAWDMKRMLKVIVTSATYRQSSKVNPELYQRDPYNRLLARGPRRRMEAEMVRDASLTVSGLLSSKMGGPPVMPPQPDGVWQVVYSGDKWETSKGEDRYRRGLYTFWRRTSPYPSMVSFDAPSGEFCVLRRPRSNTPLQALTLLNDPVYVECAQALARRMLTEGGEKAAERAAFGVRACLGREPRSGETEKLTALAEKELGRFRQDGAAATNFVKFARGTDSKLEAAELASWTVVANVLLNLDEFVMRQ